MNSLRGALIVISICIGAGGQAEADGIHIRYGPHAPEKEAAANVIYYENVLDMYHNHPGQFAEAHPFYTQLFNDPVLLDKVVERWEAHQQRFEYWHFCLWKFLDGYVHSTPPPVIDIFPPPAGDLGSQTLGGGPGPQDSSGDGGGGGSGNGGNGSGSGTVGPAAQGVPEPSGAALVISGAIALGAHFVLLRCRSESAVSM